MESSIKLLQIDQWLGETIKVGEARLYSDVFLVPETGYIYTVTHSDFAPMVIANTLAFVDTDRDVRTILYGGSYSLQKSWEVTLIIKPIEFMAKLWMIHHEINKQDYANILLKKQEDQLGDLIQIVDKQYEVINQLRQRINELETDLTLVEP